MVALKMGIPAVLGTGKSVLNWTKRLQKPEVFFILEFLVIREY